MLGAAPSELVAPLVAGCGGGVRKGYHGGTSAYTHAGCLGSLHGSGHPLLAASAGKPTGAPQGVAQAPVGGGGDWLQGSLLGAPPRVLSCSRLHDETSSEPATWYGPDEVAAALVKRSDDVGRVFVYSRPRTMPNPPSQKGRVYRTDSLSTKGARAIQGAATKAVQIGQPFRAIWQPTIAPEYLAEFLPSDGYDGSEKPHRTLSAEFRRFWQWVTDYCAANGHKRPVYAYSCESKSDGGRDYHPHMHILTSLVLRRGEWERFKVAAEAAWGLGSIHMEVIRQPEAAARYLLKAVSYSVKGTDGDQGRVWGRRWSVSREVRAIETRTEVGTSDEAYALEEVAWELREQGKERVKTPVGCVTVRGFYPNPGYGHEHLWIAVAQARAELGEPPPEPF